ncbi:unnamed protein product [Rotaria sp. Silwood1]|nr:unnamed protein product [Rotaria sp. Silwood1]CAF1667274.1 unnamed protein product [Rotaria sp. Silwood1]CAF3909960.1 unnamed protein product [Rotaria sp. Silwood1]CAF4045012.1 unnamed protein product [Rotaria sp. Silwood1]CAF5033972.1 unnamed protein product [Rotaria sp. Silwood1]
MRCLDTLAAYYVKRNHHEKAKDKKREYFTPSTLLYMHNYTHVRQLAMHALNYTENEAMQAESCYHLAQDYHAEWNYEEAFRYYYQTTHLALEKFVLPLFDLE